MRIAQRLDLSGDRPVEQRLGVHLVRVDEILVQDLLDLLQRRVVAGVLGCARGRLAVAVARTAIVADRVPDNAGEGDG